MLTHDFPSPSTQYGGQLLLEFILGSEFVSFFRNLLDFPVILVDSADHILEVAFKGSDMSLTCGSCLESDCGALHLRPALNLN